MKKIILLFIFCVALWNDTQAQQIHQLTQYNLNDFVFNPAIAGSRDKFVSKLSFRKQWTGLEGSPTTFVASLHGKVLPDQRLGAGLILYSDVTGPTRRTGAQLAVAYQQPLNENGLTLGGGLSGNLMQYSVDFSKLVFQQGGDPQTSDSQEGKLGGDVNIGTYLRGNNFFVGLSLNQLLATKYNFFGDQESLQNSRHLYLSGGYRFDINDDFAISPSILMKYVSPVKPQFELTATAIFKKQFWGGLSYRTEDAFAIMAGAYLTNGFNIAYSYDITTSGLNSVSSGSHEITLGFDFNVFGNDK